MKKYIENNQILNKEKSNFLDYAINFFQKKKGVGLVKRWKKKTKMWKEAILGAKEGSHNMLPITRQRQNYLA